MNLEQKIEELREKIKPIFGEDVALYRTECSIDDIFISIANDKIDIYTEDIFSWAQKNFDIVDESMKENGVDANRGILNILTEAQFSHYKQTLLDNKEDVLKYNAYSYLRNKDVEPSESELETLNEYISNFDVEDELSKLHSYCDRFQSVVR